MSYLSVFVQYHAAVRVIRQVPATSFEPVPEVASAVLSGETRPRRLDPERGPAHAHEGRSGERTVVGQRAAALGEREDRRSLAAAGPARSDPDAARIVDGRVARLGGHPAGVELDSRAEASGSASAASGATVALASVRRVAGDTGKTAVGVPAAAQTTG